MPISSVRHFVSDILRSRSFETQLRLSRSSKKLNDVWHIFGIFETTEQGIAMIKLVLNDLDNTLIPFGQRCASAYTRNAFHVALDAGMRVGPVTGRVPAAMRWMFNDASGCVPNPFGVHRDGAVWTVARMAAHGHFAPIHVLWPVKAYW